MKKTGPSFQLSATDLVGYLNCRHLSGLDCAVAEGALAKPKVWDPLLQILWERGSIHEQNYVTHLEQAGGFISEKAIAYRRRVRRDTLPPSEFPRVR